MAAQDGHLGGFEGALFELLLLAAVLAVQPYEHHVRMREEDHDCPGALAELGHHQDPHHDPRQDGGAQLITSLCFHPRLRCFRWYLRHPRPGHGETGEDADGVHRH